MSKALPTIAPDHLDQLFLEVTTNPHRLILCLLADTGLRVGELCNLLRRDLWLAGQPVTSLQVRAAISKTGTPRILPLSVRSRDAISQTADFYRWLPHPDPTRYALNTWDSLKPATTRSIQRLCASWGQRYLHGARLTPHMFRHTFATRLMRVTNIRVVQQLLGHAALSSTMIYTHPNSLDLAAAIAKIAQ